MSEELAERIVRMSDAVALPPSVVGVLTSVRAYLRDGVSPPIYVSDRRLKKAAKASSVCWGR